jgi:hypothetical protein
VRFPCERLVAAHHACLPEPVVHREIAEQGYTGGYLTLARYLRPLRGIDEAALAGLPPRLGSPAVGQVAGWITFRATSFRPMRSGCVRSGSAAPSWTPPSGKSPASPG